MRQGEFCMQFSAFLKVGLLQDMLCTFNAEKREFSSIITLGKNVCGHPTIVHGGLTAAIVDETLGGLYKTPGVLCKMLHCATMSLHISHKLKDCSSSGRFDKG